MLRAWLDVAALMAGMAVAEDATERDSTAASLETLRRSSSAPT